MGEYNFGLDPEYTYKSPFDSYQLPGYESPYLSSLNKGLSDPTTSLNLQETNNGGFLSDLGGLFKDSKFLGSALNTVVGLGSQLWANRNAEKTADEDRKRAAEELALKAKYGLLGGQGGGGGSGTTNLLNAYQAAIAANQASANAKGQALERLINASTRPLLR